MSVTSPKTVVPSSVVLVGLVNHSRAVVQLVIGKLRILLPESHLPKRDSIISVVECTRLVCEVVNVLHKSGAECTERTGHVVCLALERIEKFLTPLTPGPLTTALIRTMVCLNPGADDTCVYVKQ